NNWSDEYNWNKDVVPTSKDTVFFNNTGIKDSLIDKSFDITKLQISRGYSGTITQGKDLSIATDYIQRGGTFSADTYNLFIGGNFSNSGIFDARAGTVEFNKATGTQTIDSGGVGVNNDFYIITHSGEGTLQLVNNDVVINNKLILTKGKIDLNGKALKVSTVDVYLPVSLQTAIDLVNPTGTVNVGEGAYAEDIIIAKDVTLTGLGSGATATSFTLNSGEDVTGSTKVSAPTINVNNGAKINDGILLVSSGGTVNVATGTYTEELSIGKPLILSGAGKTATILDGSTIIGTPTGINITLNNVTVTKLGIKNYDIGIDLGAGVSDAVINDNAFTHNTTYHVRTTKDFKGDSLYNIYLNNKNTYDEAGVITETIGGTTQVMAIGGYRVIYPSLVATWDAQQALGTAADLNLFHIGPLDTTVISDPLDTHGGSITITNKGDVTLGPINTGGGTMKVIVNGDPNLIISGPIDSGGGNIDYNVTGYIWQKPAGTISTHGGYYHANAAGGYYLMDAGSFIDTTGGLGARDITLQSGTTATLADIKTDTTLSITAGGAITQIGAFSANLLNLTNTVGPTTLDQNNAISNLGAITTTAGDFTLNNKAAGGTALATTAANIIAGTGHNISIDTGAAAMTFNATTIKSNNFTVTAKDIITLNNADLTNLLGILTLQPDTAARTIGLAGGTGIFNLDTGEISSISTSGASSVVIGRTGGTGIVTLGGNVEFGSKNVTLNSGRINDPNNTVRANNLNLILTSSAANTIKTDIASLDANTTSGMNTNLTVNETDGISLGTIDVGRFTLTAGGAITQTGTITATGTTTLAAGATNDITLDSANNFSTVTITSGKDVTLNDINALILGASTVAGDLSVTTAGKITQNGALNVTGTTTLAAGATSNITLTNSNNNFNTIAVTSGNNVNLRDIDDLILGPSAVSGNLRVTTNRAITQSGILNVATGTTTLAAGALNDITLGSANNFRTIAITNGHNVTLNDINALVLGASTVSGDLNITTANGTITDNGKLTVTGATTLSAGGPSDIILNNSNDFQGGVSITSCNNATLKDINTLILGASTVSGALNLTTNGTITQSGAITANTLTANLSAGSIELGTFANNITNLGAITAPGGFTLDNGNNPVIATGAINTAGSNGPISIDVGTGEFTSNIGGKLASGSGVISITADSITLGDTITGSSTLLLHPTTIDRNIHIGDGVPPPAGFILSSAEIALLTNGFSSITIGRPDGSGSVIIMAITFNDPVTIQAPVAPGSITVNGQITGADNASITLDGSGATTTLNADIITAGNPITISDSVLLGTPATLTLDTTSGAPLGADIKITGTINDTGSPSGLILNAGSARNIDLQSAVGDTTKPSSLTAAANTINISGGNIGTIGIQNYNGPAILGANTILTGSDITFGNTLSNAVAMTLAITGNAVFNGTVGAGTALTSLTVSGTTAINGGSVNTSGIQTYTGAVTLGNNTILTGSDVTFGSTLDSDAGDHRSLLVNGSGITKFIGTVGGTDSLLSLETDAAGSTQINGGAVTTTTTQTYNDPVALGAAGGTTTLTGKGITFNGTLNSGALENALSVIDSGIT
ncbi:MAG: beta strand repeat-containing protein, partial [Desulfocucumaceae bacterium]